MKTILCIAKILICFHLRKRFKNFYFPKFEIIHFDSAIASETWEQEAGIWKNKDFILKSTLKLMQKH